MAALKVCSINTNGFRKAFKRHIVLYRLKNLNFDVVLLQETHITNFRDAHNFY